MYDDIDNSVVAIVVIKSVQMFQTNNQNDTSTMCFYFKDTLKNELHSRRVELN